MKVKLGRKTSTLILVIFLICVVVVYGVGTFLFMLFPNTFDLFVSNYPIFSHFGKLFIGWIVFEMLSKNDSFD